MLAQPAAGRAVAETVLEQSGGDEAAAIAWRAVGLSWKENGDLARAVKALRRAIKVAEEAGLPYPAAEARMSLVVILADRGNTDGALAEAALADTVLTGVDRARLRVNLGLVLGRTGRTAEALEAFDSSQPALRAAGDTRWEALLVNMRGIIHAMQGRHREAVADLLRGEDLAHRGSYHLLNGMLQLNLGWVARLTGDVPGALARLDRAAALYAEHGKGGTNLAVDKADMLLAAGMASEARATIAGSIAEQESTGFRYNLAEFHLYAARAALADQDPAAAAQAALRTARTMFGRQRRGTGADQPRHAEVSARFASGERSPALLKAAVELGDRMTAAKSPSRRWRRGCWPAG